ncbi:hypothetical protein AAFF_G00147330 [Aldrovandia affinis]|uniref:Protein SSUH2 homolog n=1 Tax=Aldrovandia affinis TaxID=143900 RepID=A0AAD7RQ12_9TELE|nr:hypothetical protein AAFF_G00147330 [Aldrovandia affinis]
MHRDSMDRQPMLSGHGPSYGTVNPGYMAPAAGSPAMFAPQGPLPSAPPAGMFDTVPGYEGTVAGGEGGFLLPPGPAYPPPTPQQTPTQPDWNIPSISEGEAREALCSYVSSKCCYSDGPATEGVITNIQSFNTYRYRLETFTEARSTEWDQQPFTGQQVDAGLQPAPGPWDISVQAPSLFQDGTQKVKVPYTSSTKPCHSCVGMGRNPCKSCSGAGSKVCTSCNGSGFLNGTQCIHCNGRGRDNCHSCGGTGSKECSTCKGKRQLLVFINLKVKWTNNVDDFVGDHSSGLPMEKLKSVSGKELFRDAQYMVYPVMGFPDPVLGQAAERLVRDHQSRFAQTGRILQQRQTIQLIPINKVNYMWKGDTYMYFVYGQESKVSADDYPATCCCCSVI